VEYAGPGASLKSSKKGSSKASSSFTLSSYGEKLFNKIQWLIVILERAPNKHCLCLPINTYRGQGVGKSDTFKHDHSIIYVGKHEPEPTEKERPDGNEKPMLPSIRVEKSSQFFKLDPMSRICYSKIHTFEFNLRIQDFGMVHKRYFDVLQNNFWSSFLPSSSIPKVYTSQGDENSYNQGYQNQNQHSMIDDEKLNNQLNGLTLGQLVGLTHPTYELPEEEEEEEEEDEDDEDEDEEEEDDDDDSGDEEDNSRREPADTSRRHTSRRHVVPPSTSGKGKERDEYDPRRRRRH